MSDNRRHTDVLELGWLDFLAACEEDPLVRCEGRNEAMTFALGKLVRFNLALIVHSTSAYYEGDVPRVHAERTRRAVLDNGDEVLLPTGKMHTLRWDELDWVSWDPLSSASGRRAKVTTTGQSWFGEWQVFDDTRLLHTVTREVRSFPSHGAAVAQALRLHTR